MQASTSTLPDGTQPDRFDLYGGAHKGLRAALGATLRGLDALDAADCATVKLALDLVDDVLDACASHLAKEDRHVHPALEARAPGSTARLAGDHVDHVAAIAILRELAHAVACASPAERARSVARLSRAFTGFVADNLEHMTREETEHNALLWRHFRDDELAAIHAAIVAASTPADLAWSARWMVPNLTPAERTALLEGVRAAVPAEAFAEIVALVRPHLSAAQWHRLAADLGLPAATATDPRDVAARFVDAIFVRFAVDEAAALVTEDFIAHPWAPFGIPPGPAGLASVVAALRGAFGGVGATLTDLIVDGDRVAVRYEYAGRHVGDLFGIAPTGRAFRFAGIAILRISEDGRVAEYWREEDVLTLQRQLGVASLLPEHQPGAAR